MAGRTEDARFGELFGKPSLDGLRALSQADFRDFVTFVFQRAGYVVSKRMLGFATAVDLDLFKSTSPREQVGSVAAHQTPPDRPLSADFVRSLQRNAPVRKRGVVAYAVTSGSYDKKAYQQAGHGQNTYLLDGDALCRYIRYVHNSRFPEGLGLMVVIPPDLFASGVSRPPTERARILVFANNKGGVGKTTSARQMALRMADSGLRVLLVDVDPQGNLTEGLIVPGTREEGRLLASRPNLVQYFAGEGSLPDLVRPASIEGNPVNNVYLIPAHPELSLLDTGGAGMPALEMRFAHDLWGLAGAKSPSGEKRFDWVMIDTPPAISLYTRAALCAADFVIAPARARPSSFAGILNMLKTMDTLGELRGNRPDLLGCLLTHWDKDQHSRETYPDLETVFARRHSRVLADPIPFDPTVEKLHGPTHHLAMDAYVKVTQEVLNYVDRN